MRSFDDLRKELIQNDPEYILLEIVGKLMAARERKKISQRDLSKLTGVAQKTISRIENGKDSPELITLVKLARALNLEIGLVDKNVKDEQAAAMAY